MTEPHAVLRVMVVDDHRVFTELLAFALDARPGIRCVARARTVRAALEVAKRTDIDVAVLDVQLPDGDGIDLADRLRDGAPGVRCIALTAFPTSAVATRAEAAGVRLLAKDGSLDRLLAELAAVTPRPATAPDLTPREREVAELLDEGLDVQAISRALSISVHTTRGHVKLLLHKTGTRSQLEALAAVRRAGLLHPMSVP